MGRSGVDVSAVVPVHVEPRHRLVHESPGLRVLDIRIPAGDVTLFHSHDDPTVYVTLEDAPVATQRPGGDWERSGSRGLGHVTNRCDYFTDPLVHRVRNDGPGLFHMLGVVNADAGEDGLHPSPDAELANEWFVVRRFEGMVGDGPSGTTRVLVHPASGTWQVVLPGGWPRPLARGATVEIEVGHLRR